MTSQELHKFTFQWPLFLLLIFLEAATALLALIRIPVEGARLILGFSAARWGMMLPLMASMAVSLILARMTRRSKVPIHWLDAGKHSALYTGLSGILAVLSAGTAVGSFLLRWYDPSRYLPFFERAFPFLAFIIIASLQTSLWFLFLRFGFHKIELSARKPAWVAFVALILVFVFVAATRLGLTPDHAYWGEPGAPIQFWQLGLALIGGLGLFVATLFQPIKRRQRLINFLLPFFVWGLAVFIWLSVPNTVLKNSFYFPIDPPANAPFPYSDSGYYDYMAHSLLLGTDYAGEIPTRPLYIVFLTVLHLIFGERYDLIIIGQTLALAFIPVLFYALGKSLHSRTAGLIIALLAIFREWTTLLVSSETRVSNSKILLVDLPTLLFILLACFLAFRWLERKDRMSAFVAGGTFGILILLRTQSMLILPVIILVSFFSLQSEKRPWLAPLTLFLLSLGFSIIPWLTHNYLRIGSFSFDAPFQYQLMASQYSYAGLLEYQNTTLEGKSLANILLTFLLTDPGFVLGFVANHFLATLTGALLALPLIAPFHGLQAPVNVYWTSFNGALTWDNIILLIAYLVFIAIGLGAAWKRWHWAGLTPMAFSVGYALANGIGRFSGWRYDLPADWIAYFYFGIGIAEIFTWVSRGFGAIHERDNPTEKISDHPPAFHFLLYSLFFILIGALPWLAESINSTRYQQLSPIAIQEQLANHPKVKAAGISAQDIRSFNGQPEAVVMMGRPLYPRTFPRGVGLSSSNPWQAYAIREYPRLGFLLLNENVREIVLPIKQTKATNIHAMDVLILGCERGDYIEARLAVFPNENMVLISDRGFAKCNQPEN